MRAALCEIIILALRFENALATDLLVHVLNIANNADRAIALWNIISLIFLVLIFLITIQIKVSLNSFLRIAPNKFLT